MDAFPKDDVPLSNTPLPDAPFKLLEVNFILVLTLTQLDQVKLCC
jgi:hypothetical protein